MLIASNAEEIVRKELPLMHSWYHVASSSELKNGQIITKKLCNTEVVIYRTKAGDIRAIDPYCPHLGAHLGHGGRIVGESIECPFHGWQFDVAGKCTTIPYSEFPAPKRGCLKHKHVREFMGLIMVWFHPEGKGPSFGLDFDNELLDGNWSKSTLNSYIFDGYIQELVENIIDVGHFPKIHKYDKLPTITECSVNGHILTAGVHTIANRLKFFEIDTELRAQFSGCGLSCAVVTVANRWRLLVVAGSTPQETGKLKSTFTIRYERSKNPLSNLVGRFLMAFFEDDFLNGNPPER